MKYKILIEKLEEVSPKGGVDKCLLLCNALVQVPQIGLM